MKQNDTFTILDVSQTDDDASSTWQFLRRRYLVNPSSQLSAATLVALVVAVPLIVLNVSLHLSRAIEHDALFSRAPQQVVQQAVAFDRTEFLLVLIASIIFVVGVFIMTILVTHRTYGAAVGIARHLGQIRDGDYETRLQLRDSDRLTELVEPFNDMAAALQARSSRRLRELDAIADEIQALEGGSPLAARIRRLAEDP